MNDLHNAIMNLPCNVPDGYAPGKADEAVYRIAHRDARHAAAELVSAHLAAHPAGAEAKGAEADAKRYRWLQRWADSSKNIAFGPVRSSDELDAVIDAAMAQEPRHE